MSEICKEQSTIEAEIRKYIDNGIEFIPDAPILQKCESWCSIVNWSTTSWDLTAWTSKCVKTKSDAQAALNKLLINPYSSQARLAFLGCTGISVPGTDFGI